MEVDETMSVKRIARIAIFAAVIFVQEFALSFIPNVQFTQCLIAICYYAFGLLDTLLVVTIHVILDNLAMGSFNLIYTPAMFIGWITLPLFLHLFRKNQNKFFSATLVGLHGIVYSLLFAFANSLIKEVPFLSYFLVDIPYEVILVVNGFVTTLLLKDRLVGFLKKLTNDNKSLHNI